MKKQTGSISLQPPLTPEQESAILKAVAEMHVAEQEESRGWTKEDSSRVLKLLALCDLPIEEDRYYTQLIQSGLLSLDDYEAILEAAKNKMTLVDREIQNQESRISQMEVKVQEDKQTLASLYMEALGAVKDFIKHMGTTAMKAMEDARTKKEKGEIRALQTELASPKKKRNKQ